MFFDYIISFIGNAIDMCAIRWELEQHDECRCLECELEQQPHELEQQCVVSGRL